MAKDARPTPAGGDLSAATYYDAAGRQVSTAQEAQTVEIAERTRDGDELARTYLSRATGDTTPAAVRYADPGTQMQDGDYADFAKSTWDIWDVDPDGLYSLVTTKDQLLRALGFDTADLATQRQVVSTVMVLPAWDAAPRGLQQEVGRWLENTRPKPGGSVPPAPTGPEPSPPAGPES